MYKNFGLIIPPIKPEDFVFGSSQSIGSKYGADVFINPKADWSPFTPSTEDQSTNDGDTYACVSFNTENAVEMLARCRFGEGINLSDRFLAKTSGTVVGQGNSPTKVADTLRHGWSVNETEWPDVDTVEEFYAEIPGNLKTLAIARGAEFEFGYQIVPNNLASIKSALHTSPVCIAVTAWVEQNGVYVRGPFAENHWTTIIKVLDNGNYQVFDSFYPFIKEVSPEACKSIAMSYYLNKQVVSDNLFTRFIKAILALFTNSKPESITEQPPVSPVEALKPELLWDTPTNVRHSLRVMCDNAGLYMVYETTNGKKWNAKDIITACVFQESRFNPKAIGKVNSNGTKDWGLCQYNDGKLNGKFLWIGPGAAFKDTNEVLNDPEKNIRIMIQEYKAGYIWYWSSYKTGAFKQWLGKV